MELHFGASLQGRAVSEQKNSSPLEKRADFQNYSPREPFWLSFFLSAVPSGEKSVHLPFQMWGKNVETHKNEGVFFGGDPTFLLLVAV